ncbi:hypothetical protein [Acinetobacter baumannii]|uniref:hypothetical protein n=1 Tax=Acinetobacter baumannii TaxID=470 RepID=UPI001CA99AF5|nr:hypothetical protein [Acinetobacter baumannii]UAB18963.1 hypothetical protein H2785_12665 [Acinetobacter baumannii]UAB22405.1 hypothetical protein H2784_12630 [Acinetobacter baumannii]
MKFDALKSLVESTDWVNVPGEAEYIAADDISLRFKYSQWIDVDPKLMQENMKTVLNQLKDKCNVHSINANKVIFEYENRQVYSLYLFNFICTERDEANTPVNVLFAKSDLLRPEEPVTDPFYLSLIKYLNNAHELDYLKYATGQIF